MIKRTLEISREPAHLALRHQQLVLNRNGQVVGQVPCEDLGVVVVDHPQATYSHAALTTLAECGAVVVLCGKTHQPTALLLPLSEHSQIVWRLRDQLAAKRPLRKNLWRQLVVAKIRGQARNLDPLLPAHQKLMGMASDVRSGDPNNLEAQAAKTYWQHWLSSADSHGSGSSGFQRDTAGDGLNAFLNYGYAIIRAAVSRAIVAAGLLPSLGIHHRHRANAFCLADDLIEPLRPVVDARVREMHRNGMDSLDQTAKAELLRLLGESVETDGQVGPLMVALHRMAASLAKCFAGESKLLEIPKPASQGQSCASRDTD